MNSICVELTLPLGYPIDPLHCRAIGPNTLPARLIDYVNTQIRDWIEVISINYKTINI